MAVAKGFGQYQGNENQRQLDADSSYPTPGITQYIPINPGPPLPEQYAPAIHVRVVPNPAPFLVHIQPFLLCL